MDVVVITFDGQIEDFPVLVQTVDQLIDDGVRRLVIDLHTLPFINSHALGYLVKAYKGLREQDGEFALCRVQPAILNILEMTNLDALFPTFQTIEEAVDHLGAAARAAGHDQVPIRHHAWRGD